MIRFAGRLDPALYRRAHRLALGGVLPVWLVYLLVAAALAAGLALFLLLDQLVAGALAFSLGILGGLVLALYELAVRRAGRTHRQAAGRIEGSLDEDAFRVTGPHGPAEIPWSRLHHTKTSRSLLLLYESPRLFHVLARELFAGPEDWRAARALVTRKLPGSQQADRRRLLWIFLATFLLFLAGTLAWITWRAP